jgi:dTDP-glucose pyrophosphorylase
LTGLSGAVTTAVVDPRQFMLASDVYLAAGDAVLTGGDIDEVTPPDHPGYHYHNLGGEI